jgi:hypothetical protein
MDAGAVTDMLLEQALTAGRQYREEMARWLAVEVLITDKSAGRDSVLQERLLLLQEQIEDRLRAKTALNGPIGQADGAGEQVTPRSGDLNC